MEDLHKNYDAVFKEALTLFKDKTLDFFGEGIYSFIIKTMRDAIMTKAVINNNIEVEKFAGKISPQTSKTGIIICKKGPLSFIRSFSLAKILAIYMTKASLAKSEG